MAETVRGRRKCETESERHYVGNKKVKSVIYEEKIGALYRIPTDPWCKWMSRAQQNRTSGTYGYDPRGRATWYRSLC